MQMEAICLSEIVAGLKSIPDLTIEHEGYIAQLKISQPQSEFKYDENTKTIIKDPDKWAFIHKLDPNWEKIELALKQIGPNEYGFVDGTFKNQYKWLEKYF